MSANPPAAPVDDYAALVSAIPPSPRAGAAEMQGEALFFGHAVGPEAHQRIGFLAAVASQAPDAWTRGFSFVQDIRRLTQSVEQGLPFAAHEAVRTVQDIARHRVLDALATNRAWFTETCTALADCAATYMALAMPSTEVSDRLSRAMRRFAAALDEPTGPGDWSRELHAAMRTAVATRLEHAALANVAWAATVSRPASGPPKVEASNPAVAVLEYLRAALPDAPGASLWPPPCVEVVAPHPASPKVVDLRLARTRRAAASVKASFALAGASALTLLGDTPRAWLRRTEALVASAACRDSAPAAGLEDQAAFIAARLHQWGPREWHRIPPAQAALLAQQLDGLGAASLAALFRAHAGGRPPAPSRH